jgi:hypothetical protein
MLSIALQPAHSIKLTPDPEKITPQKTKKTNNNSTPDQASTAWSSARSTRRC